MPDQTTEALSESEYGTELVIRSATTRYMALSIAQGLSKAKTSTVRAEFEPLFAKQRDWSSAQAMLVNATKVIAALENVLTNHKVLQQPLLMQPIWKTQGKRPLLAEHCLDVVVWSDFALAHLFLASARAAAHAGRMTRQLRAALRLSRFLYEHSTSGKVYQAPIFDGMSYDLQTDKEFSISGSQSRKLMAHTRLTQPAITKSEIQRIILGGGQRFLSPERRFDAILYFATDLFSDTTAGAP